MGEGRSGDGIQHPGHRRTDHQRHGAGGRDADGGHNGHCRRRRSERRIVHLPVGIRRRNSRYGYREGDRLDLQARRTPTRARPSRSE